MLGGRTGARHSSHCGQWQRGLGRQEMEYPDTMATRKSAQVLLLLRQGLSGPCSLRLPMSCAARGRIRGLDLTCATWPHGNTHMPARCWAHGRVATQSSPAGPMGRASERGQWTSLLTQMGGPDSLLPVTPCYL